jgi:hypothetical protein
VELTKGRFGSAGVPHEALAVEEKALGPEYGGIVGGVVVVVVVGVVVEVVVVGAVPVVGVVGTVPPLLVGVAPLGTPVVPPGRPLGTARAAAGTAVMPTIGRFGAWGSPPKSPASPKARSSPVVLACQ